MFTLRCTQADFTASVLSAVLLTPAINYHDAVCRRCQPAINTKLGITQRIFVKIYNGSNKILRGERKAHELKKKPRKSGKSRDRLPLRIASVPVLSVMVR